MIREATIPVELKIVPWFKKSKGKDAFSKGEFKYGINIKMLGQWAHLCEGKDALIFDTRKEAMGKINQMYPKAKAEKK